MKRRVCFRAAVLLVATMIGFAGCPQTEPKLNSLTVHNNLETTITYLSVVRVGDVGSKVGINLLPEPIPHGGTFDLNDLIDGKYDLTVTTEGYIWKAERSRSFQQTFEGGKHYDWYVNRSKSGGIEVVYDVAPTAKTILDAILY